MYFQPVPNFSRFNNMNTYMSSAFENCQYRPEYFYDNLSTDEKLDMIYDLLCIQGENIKTLSRNQKKMQELNCKGFEPLLDTAGFKNISDNIHNKCKSIDVIA